MAGKVVFQGPWRRTEYGGCGQEPAWRSASGPPCPGGPLRVQPPAPLLCVPCLLLLAAPGWLNVCHTSVDRWRVSRPCSASAAVIAQSSRPVRQGRAFQSRKLSPVHGRWRTPRTPLLQDAKQIRSKTPWSARPSSVCLSELTADMQKAEGGVQMVEGGERVSLKFHLRWALRDCENSGIKPLNLWRTLYLLKESDFAPIKTNSFSGLGIFCVIVECQDTVTFLEELF